MNQLYKYLYIPSFLDFPSHVGHQEHWVESPELCSRCSPELPVLYTASLRAESFSHVRLCIPMDCSPQGSSVHGDSPGNTGVCCHSLLQGIFSTQGWNPGLPHGRRVLYQLSYLESTESIVCICQSQSPDSSHSPFFLLNVVHYNSTHKPKSWGLGFIPWECQDLSPGDSISGDLRELTPRRQGRSPAVYKFAVSRR